MILDISEIKSVNNQQQYAIENKQESKSNIIDFSERRESELISPDKLNMHIDMTLARKEQYLELFQDTNTKQN
jgi:hypothetical protein